MSKRALAYACVLGLVLLPGLASAQGRVSQQDQDACTPDVFRLCSAQIPDETAIVACLTQKVSMLSAPCHRVFETEGKKRKSPKLRAG